MLKVNNENTRMKTSIFIGDFEQVNVIQEAG